MFEQRKRELEYHLVAVPGSGLSNRVNDLRMQRTLQQLFAQ